MGAIDHVKDAGEKLFGRGQAQAAAKEVAADPTNSSKVLAANAPAGDAGVEDMMSVDPCQPEARHYTAVSGGTLSKVSRQYCGDANEYVRTFEANKPMLTSSDKIYPGQKLRIPPQ